MELFELLSHFRLPGEEGNEPIEPDERIEFRIEQECHVPILGLVVERVFV